MDFTSKKCMPCEKGSLPLSSQEIQKYLSMLVLPWKIIENKKISHEFKFKNFKESMAFVNFVADLAESEGHHPDIHISYRSVYIELWTHAIGGLSENDFILAAKIETLTR